MFSESMRAYFNLRVNSLSTIGDEEEVSICNNLTLKGIA